MDDEVETNSMRFIKADIAPLVLNLLVNVTAALHSSLVTAYNVAARHANFLHDQATFQEEAAIEIETLTGDVDG